MAKKTTEELRQKRREYKQRWLAKPGNREKLQSYFKEYRANHKDEFHVYQRNYRLKRRLKAIAYLGGVCKRCGFDDERALQIDHVHGGGRKELLHENFDQNEYYDRIMNEEPGTTYQLLCANCNWIKRAESPNEHPPGRRSDS